MRKALFIILLSLFIFTGCKDKDKKYTDAQTKALSELYGNYQAYLDHEKITAVISFTAHYQKPRAMYDGKTLLFYAHGECSFADDKYPIPDVGYILCYYSLSDDADIMYFYYKGGVNNKDQLREYQLYIKSNTVFHLTDGERLLVFEKVK